MIAYFQIIRPVNLLIIAVTQWLFWKFLYAPPFDENHINYHINTSLLISVILMTVLIAAAGYVINDYMDVQTDLLNKSDKTLVTKAINKTQTIQFYYLLNAMAVALALFIFFNVNSHQILLICSGSILLLWLYSVYYKSTILLGNIIVSFFLCMVPFIFYFIETSSILSLKTVQYSDYKLLLTVLVSYVIFAFLSNLIREIIKDCEDIEGDKATGVKTFPTMKGLNMADKFNLLLSFILLLATIFWITALKLWLNSLNLVIFIFLVIVPIVFLMWNLLYGLQNKSKYRFLSKQLKINMGLGILYLFIHLNL